jgi:hypothetical protein
LPPPDLLFSSHVGFFNFHLPSSTYQHFPTGCIPMKRRLVLFLVRACLCVGCPCPWPRWWLRSAAEARSPAASSAPAAPPAGSRKLKRSVRQSFGPKNNNSDS